MLEKAHSMLMYLRDHTPEDQREGMVRNIPLYGEIVDAWNAR